MAWPGAQGDADGLARPGAHGLLASRPFVEGEQGLSPRTAGPRPGAQGLPGPQGLRTACASWIAVSVDATGVGAGAVAAMAAAAIVDRLPASSTDFIRLTCMVALPFKRFVC